MSTLSSACCYNCLLNSKVEICHRHHFATISILEFLWQVYELDSDVDDSLVPATNGKISKEVNLIIFVVVSLIFMKNLKENLFIAIGFLFVGLLFFNVLPT